MNIAFQGEAGAFSETAILEHYGSQAAAVPCETFDQVFAAVEGGACEAGFVPIENSLAGSIHRNYDLLLKHSLVVIGEHYLPVHHCLIGLPGAERSGVRKVISHPQALAQCESYLRSLAGVQVEPVYDTAGSVKMVRDQGDLSVAAIASQRAAELYSMAVLAENIEDHETNITRFLIIARQAVHAGEDAKTSIVFALKNQPGALFKALSVFALRDLDLTKIESRPLVGTPWEYIFYIDFAASSEDLAAERALAHLDEYAKFLRVLGSYPRHRLES